MTACNSFGLTSKVRSSVTTRAPNFFRSPSRRSMASVTAEPPPQLSRDADETSAREQDDEHEHWPEDHLPILGEAGQPLLSQKIGCGADDRAVERAQPAEQHHDNQFTRALPGHVGGAHELAGIGEQEAGQTSEHARDHIGRELKAVDVESHRRHPDGVLFRAAQNTAEARADEGAAKKIGAEESDEHDIIERTPLPEPRDAPAPPPTRDPAP